MQPYPHRRRYGRAALSGWRARDAQLALVAALLAVPASGQAPAKPSADTHPFRLLQSANSVPM
jgi:hypothetical protein